jgi:hypothetical protein
MRSKCQMVAVAVLAVFALGAVASASASAEACKKKAGSKKFALCIAGQKISEAASLSFHTKPVTTFQLVVPGQETTEECQTTSGGAQITNAGLSEINVIGHTPCGFTGFYKTSCHPSGLSFGYDNGLISAEYIPLATSVRLYSQNGGGWGETLITGAECPDSGNFNLHAGVEVEKAHCTFSEKEVESAAHTMACSQPVTAFFGLRSNVNFEEVTELSEAARKGQKYSIIESA